MVLALSCPNLELCIIVSVPNPNIAPEPFNPGVPAVVAPEIRASNCTTKKSKHKKEGFKLAEY